MRHCASSRPGIFLPINHSECVNEDKSEHRTIAFVAILRFAMFLYRRGLCSIDFLIIRIDCIVIFDCCRDIMDCILCV